MLMMVMVMVMVMVKNLFNFDITPSAGVMYKVDTMGTIISNQLINNNFSG